MNRQSSRVTVFAVVLLGLLLIGLQPVLGSTVGPVRLSDGVTVYSPVNAVYNSKNILFNYTFAVGMGMHYSLNYMLDGSEAQAMPYSVVNPQELHVVYSALGQVQLPELPEGTHTLTISLEASFGRDDIRSYSDTIYFTIDTNAPDVILDTSPPKITIQSPQTNQTYAGTVPLNVFLSEPTTQLTVKLDGNRTITLPTQNTTLTDLTVGTHSLSIEAKDLVGNRGYSNRVSFNVTQPTPTPTNTSTPTPPSTDRNPPHLDPIYYLIPMSIIVAILILSLLLFTRHRKTAPPIVQ